MKKVVVTGATGMIGVTLIEYLLSKNIEVLAIIRENSKRRDNLKEHKNLKVVECNLENLKKLNIEESYYDVFYHFGWDGTFGNDRNQEEKQKLNVEYTLDAVKLAKRLGCNTFIGAGSQAEYGRVEGVITPQTETNPETEYGKAKLLAGIESRKLANQLEIKHIWTRIFSVYGPYDGESTMVMTSIREMLNGKSPDYTLGEQNWDYLYSKDAIKAMFLLGENGINNKVYCIANGKTKKLYEYINIIKDSINSNITLSLGKIPYSEKQVMNLYVDISELTNDTNFISEISFEEGIKETIEWYKIYHKSNGD